AWSEKLILHKSEKEQNFTGSVRIVGPVLVVESFRNDWINGINVSVFPGVLVDKNAHQIEIVSCTFCLKKRKWIFLKKLMAP
ncbi:putative Female sterile M3, partial [Daphnia magna]